jgi:hypothetical protein
MKNLISKVKRKWALFFKKEEITYSPPWWSECWAFLTGQPIGTEFLYLGIKMIIIRFEYDFNGWVKYGIRTPSMACQYADKNGQLHELVFTTHILPLVADVIRNKTTT